MRIELTRGLGFSAAHFLIEHEKCEHLHGHNWSVRVSIEGEPDERGIVVDFVELKRFLKQMLGSLDHHVLLPANNRALRRLLEGKSTRIEAHGREFEFPSEDVVWLPVVNTTVEELARVILNEVRENFSRENVRRIKVWVDESPGQSAAEEVEV